MPAITETLTRPIGAESFSVDLKFENCKLTLEKKINFIKPGGATQAAFDAFKTKFKDTAAKYMNDKFKLKMTGPECPCGNIPIDVKIVEDPNGYPLTLNVGGTGASPQATGGGTLQEEDRPGTGGAANECTYAHEAGHIILGAQEEYAGNGIGTPVFTDNSIMGNYHNEGYRAASFKPRHYDFLRTWLTGKLNNSACPLTLEAV